VGVSGRAFIFGDDIDTDVLAPGRYMKSPIEELAQHCLEAVAPDFAKDVRPGDFVIAGRNFGMGSSREQAAQALKVLGVSAVVAKSFGGIFYRNALNLGLPVVVCAETDSIEPGDRLRIDLADGAVSNETSGRTLPSEPLPQFLLDMLADGGLVPHLEKKFARQKAG
jgi:3-isopropylmalate/(R)-2-methylmalate dehydratase small subunit